MPFFTEEALKEYKVDELKEIMKKNNIKGSKYFCQSFFLLIFGWQKRRFNCKNS